MALLTGVRTTIGRAAQARSFGNLVGTAGQYPLSVASYFKIGMGGYSIVGGTKVPKAPDPSKTSIEATGAAGNVYYKKLFTTQNVSFIDPSILQLECRLDPSEGNDDGNGNDPNYFEIGIFDENDVLIIYTTFAQQTKSANKILENNVQVYF